MNTIKIFLKPSGSIAEIYKDFALYQGSFSNVILNVFVPQEIVADKIYSQYVGEDGEIVTKTGVYTAVKVGAIYTKSNGAKGKTQSYYLNYVKEVQTDKGKFLLYERKMPESFAMVSGTGENSVKIITNVVNILVDNQDTSEENSTTLSVITSQVAKLDVLPSSRLDIDEVVEPTEFDQLSGKINSLTQEMSNKSSRNETVLKYNLEEYNHDEYNINNKLPDDIYYSKNGLKTRGVLFFNETFEISGKTQKGSVLVVNLEINEDYLIQNEVFIYQNIIVERLIKIDAKTAKVVSVGEWQTNGVVNIIDDTLSTISENAIQNKIVTGKINELNELISNLQTEKASKTEVTNQISNAIFTITDSAPETFDTFKEVADWIEADETGTTALVSRISNIESKLDNKLGFVEINSTENQGTLTDDEYENLASGKYAIKKGGVIYYFSYYDGVYYIFKSNVIVNNSLSGNSKLVEYKIEIPNNNAIWELKTRNILTSYDKTQIDEMIGNINTILEELDTGIGVIE